MSLGRDILIVDDNRENRIYLSLLLGKQKFSTILASNAKEAIEIIKENRPSIVITDLIMPGIDGIELLNFIKEKFSDIEVIIVTAQGSIPTAIEAIKSGAYSYLLRPFEPDELLHSIGKIQDMQSIKNENLRLQSELSFALKYDTIVGESKKIRKVFSMIDQISDSNATVMITGESGVGKELVAREIHRSSKRKDGPFIKLSSAAIPDTLLESELFGYEKGAFTGAVYQKKGRFELANRGTLFLDEIGEISAITQVKLLRAIQWKEFERVGGRETIKVDVRFITATNKDLKEEVRLGRFREDLFYRLNVIELHVPPLRERKTDIPLLVYHFLDRFKKEAGKDISSVSDEALSILVGYHWPGNVRELQNIMERAVVIAESGKIDASLIPDYIRSVIDPKSTRKREKNDTPSMIKSLKEAKDEWEKGYLLEALAINNGNVSKTSELIGIARNNLQKKLKYHKIGSASLKEE